MQLEVWQEKIESWQGRQLIKKDDELRRIALAEARTPEEQIARLDAKFGAGQGARKERRKLAAKIAARTRQPSLSAGVAAVLVKVAQRMRTEKKQKGGKSKKQIRSERRKASAEHKAA